MDPFFPFTYEEASLIKKVFGAKKFTSVQDFAKVLNLIHFWPTEALAKPAFACFLRSWFTDLCEYPNESIEVSPAIFNKFFDTFFLKKPHDRFRMNSPMRITQHCYNQIIDHKFLVLFSLCKNTGINELTIQRESSH